MSATEPLTERLLDDEDRGGIDPFALFQEWFARAQETEPNDPNAMALATADASGLPDVRMVLCNGRDVRGFAFFTNFESEKGRQLLANPQAAILFHWKSLRRQVRVRGPVDTVSDTEADAYFASRARGSQLASSASAQSRPLRSRAEILALVAEMQARLGSAPVPRPPHWSGFRLLPQVFEFWHDGPHRLHDRFRFMREGERWGRTRLNP